MINLPLTFHNLECERACVERMVSSKPFREKWLSEYKTEYFYDANCRKFFQRLKEKNQSEIFLSDIVKTESENEALEWADILEASSAPGDQYLWENIHHAWLVRESIAIVSTELLDPTDKECISNLQEKLLALNVERNEYPAYTMRDLVRRKIEVWEKGNGNRKIYHLGLPRIDDLVRIKQGNIVYIVAPPKVGKTWMESSIAAFLSVGAHVHFFSCEMHPDDLFTRIASKICETDLSVLDYCEPEEMNRTRLAKFSENAEIIMSRFLKITNARGIKFDQLLGKCRQAISQGTEIIIIDYLQRIEGPGKDERIITLNMSRKLTNMTAKNDIVSIVASQANRQAGQSEYTKAYHAKESAAIHEDADVVLSLTNKTEFANKNGDALWNQGDPYVVAVDICQRNGYSGLIFLEFDPRTGKYEHKKGSPQCPSMNI